MGLVDLLSFLSPNSTVNGIEDGVESCLTRILFGIEGRRGFLVVLNQTYGLRGGKRP